MHRKLVVRRLQVGVALEHPARNQHPLPYVRDHIRAASRDTTHRGALVNDLYFADVACE